MLAPFSENIADIGFLFLHTGRKADRGNRVYAAAAAVVPKNSPPKTFDSLVRYRHLTARERYASNVSSEALDRAPLPEQAFGRLSEFLTDVPFVFAFLDPDIGNGIGLFSGTGRIVDLTFACEFFLPQLGTPSPKRIWEFLNEKPRRRISFSAAAMTELSIDVVKHICGTLLSDAMHPEAAALRYYLDRSQTLFGASFAHIARHYRTYFGGLFDPCSADDTPDWKQFLEKARDVRKKNRPSAPPESAAAAGIDALFEGLSTAESGFAFRAEQVAYARQIADALNDRAILTIEAGTGTGKTQGYLVPVLSFLHRNPDRRAAISTYTKSLQDQILDREISRTLKVLKMYRDVPIALLKGKSSYVCAEKLDHAWEEGWTGASLLAWLYFVNITFRFRAADIDSLGPSVRRALGGNPGLDMMELAGEVSAKDGCTIRHHRCPAQIITADAYFARLVVTNHHKLALLDQDPVLAGLFSHLVIDEANHFESAVRNAFGVEVRSGEMHGTLHYLQRMVGRLARKASRDLGPELLAAGDDIRILNGVLGDLGSCLKALPPKSGNGEMKTLPSEHPAFPDQKAEQIIGGICRIVAQIRKRFGRLIVPERLLALKMTHRPLERIKSALTRLTEQEESLKAILKSLAAPEWVTACRSFRKNWVLIAMPVDTSQLIHEHFFKPKDTVIFTAATLSTRCGFDRFRDIFGLNAEFLETDGDLSARDFRFRKIPSPFPEDAMKIIVPQRSVNGKYSNKQSWMQAVVHLIPDLIQQNGGRTLVLFSSYRDLEAVAARVAETVTGMDIPLLVQQKGVSTVNLCEEFRSVKESVLFGVDTFWYGVDFRGDTLTQVIITRIPYPSPLDPIQQARKQILSPRQYWRRYAYETDIKLRQGMGRLIRSENDRGRVVFLDSRYRVGR